MQPSLNTTQLEQLQSRIKNANSDNALLLPRLPDYLLQGKDEDNNALLHIVFLIGADDQPVDYDSTNSLTDLAIAYINEQNMPHFPIIHQIEKAQWPAVSKGLAYASPTPA